MAQFCSVWGTKAIHFVSWFFFQLWNLVWNLVFTSVKSSLQPVRFPTITTWSFKLSSIDIGDMSLSVKKYQRFVLSKNFHVWKFTLMFRSKSAWIAAIVSSILRRFQTFFSKRIQLTVTPFYSACKIVSNGTFEKNFFGEIRVKFGDQTRMDPHRVGTPPSRHRH